VSNKLNEKKHTLYMSTGVTYADALVPFLLCRWWWWTKRRFEKGILAPCGVGVNVNVNDAV
jgi:hypothetical protein